MSDKVSFVPESVRQTAENAADAAKTEFKKSLKETIGQIFGVSKSEAQKKEEDSKKLAEKAAKAGRSIEEQAKIESIRKQLHQQMITPQPKPVEQASEQEDKVGTNEQMQNFNNDSSQPGNTLPPLAQPSMRRGERLKIRE